MTSHCLKADVEIFIEDHNALIKGDIFHLDGVYFILYIPSTWKDAKVSRPCHIKIGNGYLNKDRGVIVSPESTTLKF